MLGDLILFLLVLLVYLVLAASAMFFLERNHEQGDMFDSIPKSMWWAVMTVTTVGYGDAYPVTDWGYVVASLTAIFGTLMMNVPLAFILNAFDEVYNNRKKREMRVRSTSCVCCHICCHDFSRAQISIRFFSPSHGRLRSGFCLCCDCVAVWLCGCVAVWLCGCVVAVLWLLCALRAR